MEVAADSLCKTYGRAVVLHGVSFRLVPGQVTALLGPNGAGKSTTMALLLGLRRGEGSVTYGGRPLAAWPVPGRVVGAHLSSPCAHPTRSGRQHLAMMAAARGLSGAAVVEAIDTAQVGGFIDRAPGGYSLGMYQRLGLATALLGNPHVLILDEPFNGVDAGYIAWLRGFLRDYADSGRTVLLSSHLLAEVATIASHVIVVAEGRKVRDCPLGDLVGGPRCSHWVRCSDPATLASLARAQGWDVGFDARDALVVDGGTAEELGGLARTAGIAIYGLEARRDTLESAYFDLLSGAAAKEQP